MNKVLLTFVAIFCVSNANCQINNLKDLLTVSELSVQGLVQVLQNTWEVHEPSEVLSKDNRYATETLLFTYQKNGKVQAIRRTIKGDLTNGYRYEVTEFICNDMTLYKLITSNLVYQGFVLKEKSKNNISTYSDGNIYVYVNPEFMKSKGAYKITVGVM